MDKLDVITVINELGKLNNAKYDVFISYRRKDGWQLANLIKMVLSSKGYSVFLDTSDIDMKSENNYKEVIFNKLHQCKDHIIIVTESSFEKKDNNIYIDEIDASIKSIESKENSVFVKNIICISTFEDVYRRLESTDIEPLHKLANKTLLECSYFNHFDAIVGQFDSLLKSQPSKYYSLMTSRTAVEDIHHLPDRFENAKEIDVCAFGVESILTHNSEAIEKAISKGVKFKFLCQNPESDFADYIAHYNIFEPPQRKRNKVIPHSHEMLEDYLADEIGNEKYISSFEYRLTNVYLTCAIMVVKKEKPYTSHIKVDFVVPCNDNANSENYYQQLNSRNRRCVFIEENDKENFEYFLNLFDFLWNHSDTKNGIDYE